MKTYPKWKQHDTKDPGGDDIGYGVATISRLLQIIGHFSKRALQKRQYLAKETYDFKEPTNRSHPISKETYIY